MNFRRTSSPRAPLIALLVSLPLAADWPVTEKTRSRRDLPHQGRRAAALEGDGDRELPHRRLRPAPDRLAQHQGSRRLGAEDDEGVGAGERAPRDVPVRPRLAEPALRRQRADAARLSAHRLSESVDARHQRAGHRRGGDGGRSRPRRISTTYRGKLRGKFVLVDADARGAAAVRARRPPLHRRRARRSREAAGSRRARPRRRGNAAGRRRSPRKRTQFWIDEGVAAVLDLSRGDGGTLFVQARRLAQRRSDPPSAAAGRARGRALRPHRAHAREEDSGHAADGHRQQVLRRRPERLQHRRRAAGHRQGRRGRDARRALRLVAHRHGRDRQRRRLGGHDGSDAHPEDERRQAAPHGAHRRCGAARSRGCSDRRHTSRRTSAIRRRCS